MLNPLASALPWDQGSESITQRPVSIKVNIFFDLLSFQTSLGKKKHAELFEDLLHKGSRFSSELNPPKDLIERKLNADMKLSEIRVLSAYGVKSHLIND